MKKKILCSKEKTFKGLFGAHDKQTWYDKTIISCWNPVFDVPIKIGYTYFAIIGSAITFGTVLNHVKGIHTIYNPWVAWSNRKDQNVNYKQVL